MKDFSFKRKAECQGCQSLRTEVVTKEFQFEVIDKQENKRLARKGKHVSRSPSSSDEDEPEEVKKTKDGKPRYVPVKGGKKYFMRARSEDQNSSESSSSEDDDARHFVTKTVTEKRLAEDQINKKAGRIHTSDLQELLDNNREELSNRDRK